MNDKYILDEEGNPVLEMDLLKWAKWFEESGTKRRVAHDKIDEKVSVSTVFLALDYSYGEGKPVLYETMVFGGEFDGEQMRYHTKEQALKGHEEMVVKVKHGN